MAVVDSRHRCGYLISSTPFSLEIVQPPTNLSKLRLGIVLHSNKTVYSCIKWKKVVCYAQDFQIDVEVNHDPRRG